ncbi:U3 small nucleolar RNA-associated protein 14 [Melia azedarach]|uniref:U3 small nucleolar RNA-associated protein 14 n=1 Tax=Melia azedarach TaxID=155640 RepID=A0ACC1XY84_MELAZ|nr:U3 small nucleolar RNA-associated protein 14 [Melia azedarach]
MKCLTRVLSLPFMARGLEKRKEEAIQEAKLALQEYESSLKELEGGKENSKVGTTSGRRIFGPVKREASVSSEKIKTDHYYGNSDSEDDPEAEDIDVGNGTNDDMQNNVKTGSVAVHEDSEVVRILCLRQMEKFLSPFNIFFSFWHIRESGVLMVIMTGYIMNRDGKWMLMLTSVQRLSSSWELASTPCFPGNDVEEDCQKDKEEILNEKNPVPEKPNLVSGWGQWNLLQQKKGLPSWMLDETEKSRGRGKKLLRRGRMHISNMSLSLRN